MFHEFIDLYRIVVLVTTVDSQADRTNESSVLAVGIDANKGGVLSMTVAVIGLDEVAKTLRKLLHVRLDRHINQLYYHCTSYINYPEINESR